MNGTATTSSWLAAALAAATLVAAGRSDAGAASRISDGIATAPPVAWRDAAEPGFLENGGRLPAAVAFTLTSAERTFFFTDDGVTVALRDPGRTRPGRWVVRFAFDGAAGVRPDATDALPGVTNFLTGPKESWRTGLRSFRSIAYRDLWPGVDLVWTAQTGRLEWRCDVRAGADPSRIRFRVEGAPDLALGDDGSFAARTDLGEIAYTAPAAWQDADAGRERVDTAFRLDGGVLGLRVGGYDATRDLVVDPATVLRTGFIGGASNESATAVAVDAFRNLYVAGSTSSPESTFPVLTGPDVTYNAGPDDAFVLRIDATSRLAWTGYIGGSGTDAINGIVTDRLGGVFVAGHTTSPNFPATAASFGPAPAGGFDAFVAKVAFDGRSLAWCGLLGGAGDDRALAIAIEANGRPVVAGRTAGGLPGITGYGGGASDAFVAGVRSDGTAIDWGTYIGGVLADAATGVAVDGRGDIRVCGNTMSPQGTFPVYVGPSLGHSGGQDAWVAGISGITFTFQFVGYIGGAGTDTVTGIAADSQGRAYVVGSTLSDASTFPVRTGPHLVHQGKSDAFVARVSADGRGVEYCGYVGGTGDDVGYGIRVDAADRAYVVGTTGSSERGYPAERSKFPVVDGPDLTFNGGVHDGFLGVVQPDGSQMASLGYLGGKGNIDDALAVALVPVSGDVVVVGTTISPAKTFPAGAGPPIVQNGARNAYLTQIQYAAPSPVLLVPRLDAVSPNGFGVDVAFNDSDANDTGFEVQRTAATGAADVFPVPAPAAAMGPVTFTDATASPGTQYAYRVRSTGANGPSEWSDCRVVLTTPSIDLKLKTSRLSRAGADGTGVVSLRARYAFQPGSATSAIAPDADGISFTISGAGADQTIAIAPGDPGWAVSGGVFTWEDPLPGVLRIVIDTGRRTVRLDASGLTFAAPLPHNRVRIEMTSGASHAARSADWRGAKTTQFRFP